MRVGKLISISFTVWALASPAWSSELYNPEAGVVPFGMGRAYSAIADDWLSLYYNPAGLAQVSKVEVQLFDLKVGSNSDVISGYQNVKKLNGTTNMAGTLNNFAGKNVMAEVSDFSQITLPNFALGMSYQVHANIDMENTAYPQTDMRFTKDLGFSLGTAVSAGKRKDFRLGVAFRYISRQGGMKKIGIDKIANDKATLVDQFKATGSGFSGTTGIQYRLPLPGRAEYTTSFVWHDMGKTAFGSPDMKNRPTTIEDNMVVGLGIRLPIGGGQNRRLERRYGPKRSSNSFSLAFDYSHLNYSMNREPIVKHTHVGMNLDLPILSLQLGLNQSSITYGVSFDIGLVKVAAASYGEELGTFPGQKVDRRYIVSVGNSVGFKGF